MNDELLTEIWVMAKGYMDKNHIETAAEHYIDLITEHYDDISTLNEMRGADTALDTAIEMYLETHEIDEDA